MNPVSIDVKDLLVTAGIGVFASETGWAIYISEEPDKPDTCITIYDTGGFSPQYVMDKSVHPLLNTTFMIRVRSAAGGFITGHTKTMDIVNVLDHHARWNVGTVSYKTIFSNGDIVNLPRDESGRYVFICNFRAVREQK